MADKTFEVRLPDEVLSGFGWQDSEVPQGVRGTLVMELLRLDRLSEAQAAQILGLDRWELFDTMGRHRVPAIQMSPEELRGELNQEVGRGP